LHGFIKYLKTYRRIFLVVFLSFLTGCICAGFFVNRYRFTAIGELDTRYNKQHARAAEIIGRLERELEREREFNSRLRDENNRARELTFELTGTVERNVRNLQDAVSLIGDVRKKLKILADFYIDSNSADSSH